MPWFALLPFLPALLFNIRTHLLPPPRPLQISLLDGLGAANCSLAADQLCELLRALPGLEVLALRRVPLHESALRLQEAAGAGGAGPAGIGGTAVTPGPLAAATRLRELHIAVKDGGCPHAGGRGMSCRVVWWGGVGWGAVRLHPTCAASC